MATKIEYDRVEYVSLEPKRRRLDVIRVYAINSLYSHCELELTFASTEHTVKALKNIVKCANRRLKLLARKCPSLFEEEKN